MDHALVVAAIVVVIAGVAIAITFFYIGNPGLQQIITQPTSDLPQQAPTQRLPTLEERLKLSGASANTETPMVFSIGNVYFEDKVFYFNVYSEGEGAPTPDFPKMAEVKSQGFYQGSISFSGGVPGVHIFKLFICPTPDCTGPESTLYASAQFPVKVVSS